ncbi:hypothetical protein BJY04DRAFT_212696 [Aspergillus karnatakaensis]|uniref:uncharacterized protein n=1 Tax=Aspergillus karnatakaensis TaxID=1810916 RepID=UPI003CCD4ED8
MLRFAIAAIFFTALPLSAQGQTCYNPDRTISSSSTPCSADSNTFCCGDDSICLSTGYCLSVTSQPYQLYRGACTNSSWGDFCAYYCVNYRTATRAPITTVGTNADGRAIYCCGEASGNQTTSECSNGDPPFILEDGELVFGRAALADASSNSTSSSNGNGNGSGDEDSPADSDSDSDAEGTCSSSTCHSTAIGAGVGVPLGVLALSAIAWALLERRRRIGAAAGVGAGTSETPRNEHFASDKKFGAAQLSEAPSPDRPGTYLHGAAISEMAASEVGGTQRS